MGQNKVRTTPNDTEQLSETFRFFYKMIMLRSNNSTLFLLMHAQYKIVTTGESFKFSSVKIIKAFCKPFDNFV